MFQYVAVLALCGLAISFSSSTADTEENGKCGGKPADVMFVLDASSSIGVSDFQKQLVFAQNVISLFDIGGNRTRVGVALFSDTVYPTIRLTQYYDKQSLFLAVGYISYIGGGTNTGEAISYVIDKVFNSNERVGIPKIAIILTDGQSQDKDKTMEEARRAHEEGISIFVLGIGSNTDETELKAIASDPNDDFLLQIKSYSALERFKEALAIKACKVQYVAPKVLQDENARKNCHLDAILGVDSTGLSTRTSLQISNLFSDINEQLSEKVGHLKTSQITSDCSMAGRQSQKNYAPLIRKMRLQVGKKNRESKNVGVLLIDTTVADMSATTREMMRSRFQGLALYVISVGGADSSQIARLYRTNTKSILFSRRVFPADSFKNLSKMSSKIVSVLSNQCIL